MICNSCKILGMKNEAIKNGLCEKHLENPSYPWCQSKEDLLKEYERIKDIYDPHKTCNEVFGKCSKKVFTCNSCGFPICEEYWHGQDCSAKGMATNHDIPCEAMEAAKRVGKIIIMEINPKNHA